MYLRYICTELYQNRVSSTKSFLSQSEQWINLGGFEDEFFFSNTRRNKVDAQSFCTAQGGFLYEVMDNRVLIDVVIHAQKQGLGEIWLGINDINVEGTFVFDTSGSQANVLSWDTGAPSLDGDEDCVQVDSNARFNDISCDLERSVVCERKYILIYLNVAPEKSLKNMHFQL